MFSSTNKLKILLVEDNPVAQKVHTYFLRKLGFAIDLASDGRQALQDIFKEKYFAMILDLGLPDIDGETVIAKIREQEAHTNQRTPIIVVTAHGDPGILSNVKRFEQANDAFTKPVTFSKLKHALDKIKYKKYIQ